MYVIDTDVDVKFIPLNQPSARILNLKAFDPVIYLFVISLEN